MPSVQGAVVSQQLGRLFQAGTVAGLSERQLLDRFVSRKDDAAFEAIVARHGPLVLAVCRGILADPNDVDDAFQATFLVLVRKAAGLRHQERLANWLYGVAVRVARRARVQALKRKHADATAIDPPDPSTDQAHEELDIRPLIHEEVNRLPETYRAAVVLCYLECQTHEAAATQLGWPVGTVKGRLARAKEMLRARLTRKGLAVSSISLASALASEANATVPEPLIRATTTAVMSAATAGFSATTLSPHVISLASGAMQTMSSAKLKYLATLAVAGVLSAGGGVSAYQGPPAQPNSPSTATNTRPAAAVATTLPKVDDFPVNPEMTDLERAEQLVKMAEEALRSIGTDRLHAAQRQTWSTRLQTAITQRDRLRRQIEGPTFVVNEAKRNLARAQEREAALAKPDNANLSGPELELAKLNARYNVLEAENELRRIGGFRMNPNPRGLIAPVTPPAATNPDDAARNKQIEDVLEAPLSMNFPNPTPLEDVLKYIRVNSRSGKRSSIPIYVNPIGLQEAEKTLTSTVEIDIEGVPLRTTLRLLLESLNLGYEVRDGILEINSLSAIEERNRPRPPTNAELRARVDAANMMPGRPKTAPAQTKNFSGPGFQ